MTSPALDAPPPTRRHVENSVTVAFQRVFATMALNRQRCDSAGYVEYRAAIDKAVRTIECAQAEFNRTMTKLDARADDWPETDATRERKAKAWPS